MTSRLNPYLSFDGNARAAMEFYKGIFGGELVLNTFGEIGGMEGPDADRVMHGALEAPNGLVLMGADTPPGVDHKPGNDVAMCLNGDDGDVLRGYWAKLCEGGTVMVPLEAQMWGDEFGQCDDRFGVTWMVNITKS